MHGRSTMAEVATRIAPALIESGWRGRGRRPGTETAIDGRTVELAVWSLMNKAEVMGMVELGSWEERWVALTEPGRVTALEAVRARAIASRTRP